jgi:predicted permease
MVTLIIMGALVTVLGFIIGWFLADFYFWKRQDWASKVEGRF